MGLLTFPRQQVSNRGSRRSHRDTGGWDHTSRAHDERYNERDSPRQPTYHAPENRNTARNEGRKRPASSAPDHGYNYDHEYDYPQRTNTASRYDMRPQSYQDPYQRSPQTSMIHRAGYAPRYGENTHHAYGYDYDRRENPHSSYETPSAPRQNSYRAQPQPQTQLLSQPYHSPRASYNPHHPAPT